MRSSVGGADVGALGIECSHSHGANACMFGAGSRLIRVVLETRGNKVHVIPWIVAQILATVDVDAVIDGEFGLEPGAHFRHEEGLVGARVHGTCFVDAGAGDEAGAERRETLGCDAKSGGQRREGVPVMALARRSEDGDSRAGGHWCKLGMKRAEGCVDMGVLLLCGWGRVQATKTRRERA